MFAKHVDLIFLLYTFKCILANHCEVIKDLSDFYLYVVVLGLESVTFYERTMLVQ